MRRIVTFSHVSADGYFAGQDGNLAWVVQDEELDRSAAEAIARSEGGTLLFGRRTYEQFASFWPHAVDGSATSANPHAGPQRSRSMRAMAVWLNDATKVVFSTTLRDAAWKNSRLLPCVDPQEIEAMKRQPGEDIMIFGSGSIVSQLTQHGLIDEYQFIVSPILLGGGRPLVSGVPATLRLELVEASRYPSGSMKLRYTRAG